MDKDKKIALITGASKGIGKALAEKMMAENYFVIGTSTSGMLPDFPTDQLFALTLDLTDSKSIENAHEIIFKKFDHLDVLINNAGIGPDLGSPVPDQMSYDQTFEVNVKGTVFFTEPLLKFIKKNGKLINISSKMGSLNNCSSSDSIAYRMSKSALNMYSKILTNRLSGTLNVGIIHPGWVQTTICESNLKNATLTTAQSAENIYRFLSSDYESGTYWDAEDEAPLLW
ncbi:SDR family NAD(P)-dependent oxidoreductase [Chryseobacterium sp. MP_3.2]|uniref:SDR family NAD(P)-dependent oxidoreductase n=1 Tax=Chryseobacterium sp. MP_3.2 TaxID=3071712 RepID=UPI002DFC7B88|nr:NAD(P)-dependent dehydrogenase (short-subunit alcohol dehydrogenase family) [Chryseobacterium sp. MP_3.2]